jgi:hypothetical protein
MKKFLLFSLLILIAGGIWYFLTQRLDRYDYIFNQASSSPSLVETDEGNKVQVNPFALKLDPLSFYRNPFAPASAVASSFATELTEQKLASLIYPISELGSCADRSACADYCADSAQADACLNYADRAALLSPTILRQSRVAISLIASSSDSDGCTGSVRQLRVCVKKLGDAGLLAGAEVTKANQLIDALTDPSSLPGQCETLAACKTYCDQAQNESSCLAFAVKKKWLTQTEMDLLLASSTPSR